MESAESSVRIARVSPLERDNIQGVSALSSRPIFRKCFHTAYYYLDYPPRNVPTLQEWENSEQDGERTAVAVQQFVQHVASLHADGDIGFSKEYELIQSETGDYTVENSQFTENKAKNRYLNILACK